MATPTAKCRRRDCTFDYFKRRAHLIAALKNIIVCEVLLLSRAPFMSQVLQRLVDSFGSAEHPPPPSLL